MLPVIEKDLVEKNKLMSHDEFMEYATLSQSLPGVIAFNCAAFVGKHAAGTPGLLVAGFGATISAFVLMIVATIVLQAVPQNGPVAGAFECIRAASAALVLSAAFSLGRHNIKSLFAVAMMILSFVLIIFLSVDTPWVVLFAGVVGIVYQAIKRGKGGHE